jgi:hypothetical protein
MFGLFNVFRDQQFTVTVEGTGWDLRRRPPAAVTVDALGYDDAVGLALGAVSGLGYRRRWVSRVVPQGPARGDRRAH